MAHNLETKFGENGKLEASFVSVKQKAWHGLGTIVPEQMTSAECMKFANMDYQVTKQPCIVDVAGQKITSEDQFAIIRNDKKGADAILGYVGSNYEPFQNIECFDFFDSLVDDKLAMYETAGVLGKGERIFMTAVMPDHMNLEFIKGDVLKPYIFLTKAHNGKEGVKVAFSYTRIVCENTLNIALSSKVGNSFTLRHTKNMRNRMSEAQQILGISNLYKKELAQILPAMAKVKADKKMWDTVVASAFASDAKQLAAYVKGVRDTDAKAIAAGKGVSQQLINTVDAVRMYDNANPTQQMKGLEGTLWGAVNAVTGYFQNVESDKKGDKLSSIIDGRIAVSTQNAWDAAMKFAKN